MKFNNLQNNFTSGEWSPKMKGRTEVQQYAQACAKLENFIPKIYGGAFRRPSTVRVNLDSSFDTILQTAVSTTLVNSKVIPYILSTGQKYILVITTGVLSVSCFLQDAENPETPLASLPAFTFDPNLSSLVYGAANLQYTQVGDKLFLVDSSGSNPPFEIYMLNATTMVFGLLKSVVFEPWLRVPYRPLEALGSSVNMTTSGTAGAITITASSSYFSVYHVGAFFKFSNGGNTGAAVITGYTSATQVSATVLSTLPAAGTYGTAPTSSWEEAAWSNYRGWPRSITAYEGRIIYGGTATQPATIWGTRIGNVYDLMERPFEQDPDYTGYTDDNSRPFELTPTKISNIRALGSAKTLVINTDKYEIVASGSNGALGPNDVTFDSSSSFGANAVQPVRTNNTQLFLQKGGRKLRDLVFNFQEDQYKANDLSFISDHLTLDEEVKVVDPIVEVISYTTDGSYVLCKTQNGRLLSLTLDRDYQVNAWARIVLGGASDVSYPLVKSIGAIEVQNGIGDRVFLLVQRKVDGVDVLFMEYFDINTEFSVVDTTPTFTLGNAEGLDHIHLDLKYRYVQNAVDRKLSLDHLKGQTVGVIANGQYVGEAVVNSSGEIAINDAYFTMDLTDTANYVICGLSCPAKLETMPIEIGAQIPGTPQNLLKRVDEVAIRFYLTRGAKYGHVESKLYDVDFKDPVAITGNAPDLFTGVKRLKMPTDYDRECKILVQTDKPWPCNVLAIVSKGVTYD